MVLELWRFDQLSFHLIKNAKTDFTLALMGKFDCFPNSWRLRGIAE